MTTPSLARSDHCNAESGPHDWTKRLDLPAAGDIDSSKAILRQRIAELCATSTVRPENRDVFLYPSGMASMSNLAQSLQQHFQKDRPIVAIFGFLYVDTIKTLQKVYGLETTLYGHASSEDLDALEEALSSGRKIHALICEFPGNPLLQSPDLKRLHQLAKQHSFWLVVDDTVGTSVNLAILPHCDMICTSLTKFFSGSCNVMGGSLVLNPHSQFYRSMHAELTASFADTYFPPDAFVMEANSRDFAVRLRQASGNAEVLCDMLRQHPAVTHVYYPKGSSTQSLYDACRRTDGLYGYLFSVTFVTPAKAVAFYDALDVAKGPSLGTNFSLACAYTLLAHYNELEWAAQHGVVEYLVRMSVGLEDLDILLDKITVALNAAQTAE
ncbi:Pyridoxal phosphate-dependent transferase, major region, subdomain 2 [Penicillium italicum]|uniref:Pyridoxal phosphate-dependent transferase, major region, subdomain 2 n=1 Tax=Penicillium italicum TaxID=40296 RepID=A0A0A2KR21_PENIT|nr:Pyridoxal phosphate-dependent transferase, major region, subdomain 2 [Penicillium italicum]